MSSFSQHVYSFEEVHFPIKLYRESRNNVRISIGADSFIVRMPKLLLPFEKEKHINWAKDWIRKQITKNPGLKYQLGIKDYQTGNWIQIANKKYFLKIEKLLRKTHSAKLKNKELIHIKLNKDDDPFSLNQVIPQLISRVIANDQYDRINSRVIELNKQFFNQKISSIRMKYNSSNWGSCSSKGNINLSTRILFAPMEVQDYVIIHELAHLIVLDHSKKFWDIVKGAMADYKVKEKWLQENSHFCYF